jgi:hypothetical protein
MISILVSAVVSIIVGLLLANGVDNMKEQHPDYKGEDFLNWDDDKIHTEDKI